MKRQLMNLVAIPLSSQHPSLPAYDIFVRRLSLKIGLSYITFYSAEESKNSAFDFCVINVRRGLLVR